MDILSISKSQTRKALFQLYFTNPDAEYYLRELERMLHIPVTVVRYEVQRLAKEGVFVARRRGNCLYFGVNKAYPLFDELKSIVSKTIGVTAVLKALLNKVDGIEAAFIYGSYARQSESATSDIDVFIIGKIDENCLVSKLKKEEQFLKREINYSLYSRNDFTAKKKQKDSFILDVLSNAKIWLKGTENELK